MTHKSITTLVTSEKENITSKLQVRTALLAEAMPAPVKDERDAWFGQYEAEHYDNPDSVLYRNFDAYVLAAAMANKSTENFDARLTQDSPLTIERGVVVVLQDSKLFTWDEKKHAGKAGDVVVCTGSTPGVKPTAGAAYAGTLRFRGANDGDARRYALSTKNARYATAEEIDAFVTEALKNKPMNFIKLLGDAKEFEAIS